MRSLSILLMLTVSLLVASCKSLDKAQSAATKLDSAAGDVAIAANVIKNAATSFKAPPPNPDGSTNIGAWITGIVGAAASGYAAWKTAKGAAAKQATPVINAFHAITDTIEEAPATATKADLLAAVSTHPKMDGLARLAVSAAKSR